MKTQTQNPKLKMIAIALNMMDIKKFVSEYTFSLLRYAYKQFFVMFFINNIIYKEEL